MHEAGQIQTSKLEELWRAQRTSASQAQDLNKTMSETQGKVRELIETFGKVEKTLEDIPANVKENFSALVDSKILATFSQIDSRFNQSGKSVLIDAEISHFFLLILIPARGSGISSDLITGLLSSFPICFLIFPPNLSNFLFTARDLDVG